MTEAIVKMALMDIRARLYRMNPGQQAEFGLPASANVEFTGILYLKADDAEWEIVGRGKTVLLIRR